jgi:hypothetical protein
VFHVEHIRYAVERIVANFDLIGRSLSAIYCADLGVTFVQNVGSKDSPVGEALRRFQRLNLH